MPGWIKTHFYQNWEEILAVILLLYSLNVVERIGFPFLSVSIELEAAALNKIISNRQHCFYPPQHYADSPWKSLSKYFLGNFSIIFKKYRYNLCYNSADLRIPMTVMRIPVSANYEDPDPTASFREKMFSFLLGQVTVPKWRIVNNADTARPPKGIASLTFYFYLSFYLGCGSK